MTGLNEDDDNGERNAPLQELADEVAERRTETGDDFFEEAFTEQEFEEVDVDALLENPSNDVDEAVGEDAVDGEVDVVPKRTYCARCPHFSDPPEIRCEHDGTEILEFVDLEHVRVTDCPVVAQRRDSGSIG